MSGRLRAIVMMVAAALFASLMVLPASAVTNGAGTFAGEALVGKWFTSVCDKSGTPGVAGKGLYFPVSPTLPGVTNGNRHEDGVWQFSTVGQGIFNTQSGPASTFTLDACGYLGPVVDTDEDRETMAGIGAASCGNSKGHHGQGNIRFNETGERIKLFHIGWKSSAGGFLPVTGRYQEYVNDSTDPDAASKKDKYGVVVATVVARGGANCTGAVALGSQNGAQAFTVDAVAELLNNGEEEVVDPKEDGTLPDLLFPKQCKNVGPAQPPDPGGKKADGPKSAHDCTPQDGGHKS